MVSGRQTPLDPVEWSEDGWPHFRGGDLSRPLAEPRGGCAGTHEIALSDDFSTDKFGAQWTFYDLRRKSALVLASNAAHWR